MAPSWTTCLGVIVVGWYVADLLSALFHITIDSLGGTDAERVPVFGRMVYDFRMHHEEPDNPDFLGYELRHFGPATLGLLFAGLAVGLLLCKWPLLAVTVGVGVTFSQATHRWTHARNRPWLVTLLQHLHFILPPAVHMGHHVGKFDRDYGSLNGWSNPVVNTVLTWWRWATRDE